MINNAIIKKMNVNNGKFQNFDLLMMNGQGRVFVDKLIAKFKTLQEALDQPDNYVA